MKDFEKGLIIIALSFMLGCAADGSFQMPGFGFEDPDGLKVGCEPISSTMQKCEFIKPDGTKYWINMPIRKIEADPNAPKEKA